MTKAVLTQKVKDYALELGFDDIGFSQARRLETEERNLEKWLLEQRNGEMQWMENNFDKRVDPTKLVPGAKSVVTLLLSYHQPELYKSHLEQEIKISKYALGDDYHEVVRDKLKLLFEYTKEINGGLEGRVFVDSAPVLDKAWAQISGLGWQGRNSNILHKKLGSFFFIGEMISDAEFEYGAPINDLCGTCTRCIDACPTEAIYEPYKVDASKCISYFTIELRKEIPQEYHQKLGEWMYGCDICQDVCPWNWRAKAGQTKELFARPELLNDDIDFWKELHVEEYRRLFKKSAVKRTKFEGLKRNIDIVAHNKKL